MILQKILFFAFIIGFSPIALGKTQDEKCFTSHIVEAIRINKERRDFYREMTKGRSDQVFDKLISLEYLSLIPASAFDLQSKIYHEKGMRIFCDEFKNMDQIAQTDYDFKPILVETLQPFNWKKFKKDALIALREKDINKLRHLSLENLIELKKQPHHNCLTRHILESIYRFAYFIPRRQKEARELNLKDPSKMIRNVIKLHLIVLKQSHSIDVMAYPIQADGTPMICSDLPDLLSDLNHLELDILRN